MSILLLYPSWLNAVWYRRAAFESLFRTHSYLPATSTSQRSVATRPPPPPRRRRRSSRFLSAQYSLVVVALLSSSADFESPAKEERAPTALGPFGRTHCRWDGRRTDGRRDGPVAGVAVALDSTATDPSVAVVGLRADYCIGLEVGRTEHCMSVLSV